MSGDLYQRVLEWLRKTGYPLELRVGRKLQAAGWQATYSRWYRDAVSSKHRELDVEARIARRRGPVSAVFSLCIECKTSRDKPWVGLGSGRTLGEKGFFSLAVGSLTTLTMVASDAEDVPFPAIVPESTPRVGGVVHAFGDDDGPYGALLQARSAARALDAEYAAMVARTRDDRPTTAAFIPMVIVDGPLLEYSIDADVVEHLAAVEALVASVPSEGGASALVPVVTEKFANQMATDLHGDAQQFCEALLPHVPTIANALRFEEDGPEG